MWQKVIDENNGYLPLDIKAVDDGTLLKKWEPVMTVTWPSELWAHLEPLLLQLHYQSAVAGDMHYLEEIIWEWRTVEFGYRSARSTLDHIGAVRALYAWWWVKLLQTMLQLFL
jgi:nicotinic acid phosphoribosyltransferase